MNRIEIKAKAREMIKGKLWELWKPTLIIMLINFVLAILLDIFLPLDYTFVPFNGAEISLDFSSYLISFIVMPITIGYSVYVLNFIRGKKLKIDDLFCKMQYILPIWVIMLIIETLTSIGFVFLIIPGIIISLMFAMSNYVMADNDIKIGEVLKNSIELMKGHKWDYFVFSLSFLGWILLCIVTIGIAAIYVAPYMTVAEALYYEELKKLKA